MKPPPFEVADIIRMAGSTFRQGYWKALTWPQVKVFNAIVRCRTAALGGHRDQCVRCGHQAISFNSCRNRHCPKCQGNARAKWLAARSAELLPVPYFHVSSPCRTSYLFDIFAMRRTGRHRQRNTAAKHNVGLSTRLPSCPRSKRLQTSF